MKSKVKRRKARNRSVKTRKSRKSVRAAEKTKAQPAKIRVLFLGAKEFPFGARTAFKNDSLPSGGIEAYADALACELAKNPTLEITVVTRRFPGQKQSEKIAGVNVERVPWMKGFLLRNPSYNYHAFRAARKLGFDVVHAHGPVAALFAEKLGKSVVATPHGVASGQPQYNPAVKVVLKSVERRAYSRAEAVVFLSGEERVSFKEKLGFLPRRCATIPPGVDLRKYSPEANARAAAKIHAQLGLAGKFVVIFVGRLIAVKGVKHLIDAAALSKAEDCTKCVLLIAGDGPERGALEKQAEMLGISSRIKFLGERRDVPALLAASDCFVLPSLSEGMPMALLEAMAAKRPCVVTRIGLPVRDGREALVVAPGNARELELAVSEIGADAGLRRRLAGNAFAFAKKFSWKNAAKRHAELYAELCGNVERVPRKK